MTEDFKVIEAWKQTIENQRHFNEICIKIRAVAITTISAFIGAIGFLIKDLERIQDFNLLVYGIITLMASIAWFAFYVIDVKWYHKLLNGSVSHAINELEAKYKEQFPGIALTTNIKKEAEKTRFYKNAPSLKLDLFYGLGGLVLIQALL